MAGIVIPSNPYWSNLDFVSDFNLVTGKLTVDLSRSTFIPGPGVTATVQVKFPNGKSPQYTVSTPGEVVVMDIPKLINGIYWWGNYNITVTANWPTNNHQPLSKEFPLTPPDCVGDSNEVEGTLQITVDCQDGTLVGRGFSGYAYNGVMPVSEQYNITRYYPAEAEKLPQKDITMVPFVVDAWEGLNQFKGTNDARYVFENGFSVTMRINAQAQKNVHCAIDYDKLWGSVQEVLKDLRSCDNPQQKAMSLGEVNALLWVVTAGVADGKDVGDEVERLEKILGIDCNCAALAGTQVITGTGGSGPCPQVKDLVAVFNETTGFVDVALDSTDISTDYKLRFAYKNICNPSAQMDIVMPIEDQPVTGGPQQIALKVPIEAMYQVWASVVKSDGVICPAATTSTNNAGACGVIIDADESIIVDSDGVTALLYQ